jgi:hypothetical protein
MLRDDHVGSESDWTCGASAGRTSEASHRATHREIDRALRRIAKVRCGLDAEEARWMRRAQEQKIWPSLGYVHALEYLEDVFGYAPRTAQERMRVAVDLGTLPAVEEALEDGTVSWSVARELTRVATPATQDRWLAAAAGKNLRQVERLVAGHKKGSDPDDEPDPALEVQVVTVRLSPATVALLRQARAALDDESGEHLDDDAAFEAMCRSVIDGGKGGTDATSNGPARMIHLTTCRACKRTTQAGSGATFDVKASERELAECDAVICDDERGERAVHAIAPVTRRKVMARDQGRCRVPGCRAARHLDVHHIVHRAHGGGNDTSNLAVLCSGHHRLLHAGVLSVTGDADHHLTFVRDGKVLVDERSESLASACDASVPGRAGSGAPAGVAAGASAGPPSACAASPAPRNRAAADDRESAAAAAKSPVQAPSAASRYAEVERRTLAKTALTQAGFKASIAKRAVSLAETRVPPDADLGALLREALRHCC